MLARREHSCAELKVKLEHRKFLDDEIDQALTHCQGAGLCSDERFAEAYVRHRKNRGYGPLRIAAELRERGVEGVLIESSLNADDADWLEVMHQQHIKKFGDEGPRDYDEKARRVRFLQYRGFALEAILKELSFTGY